MTDDDDVTQVFSGVDYTACLRVSDTTLTLEFKLADMAMAQRMRESLLAAHASGSPITITLNNPTVLVETLQ